MGFSMKGLTLDEALNNLYTGLISLKGGQVDSLPEAEWIESKDDIIILKERVGIYGDIYIYPARTKLYHDMLQRWEEAVKQDKKIIIQR